MCSILPMLQDSESLYGWAGRFHLVSGFATEAQTSRYLFGNNQSAFRLALPTSLEAFLKVTGGHLGTLEDIVTRHTNFPAYRPFLDESEEADVINCMLSGRSKKVTDSLNDTANKNGVFYRMRLCRLCVQEDMNKEAVSLWHLEHLMPLTWVCLTHGCLLEVVKPEVLSYNSLKFIFPHEIPSKGKCKHSPISSIGMSRLEKVARFANYVSSYDNLRFDYTLLRFTYLFAISELNLFNARGEIKVELFENLLNFHQELFVMPGAIGSILELRMHTFLFNLTRWMHHHPNWHFLLMSFLFESPCQMMRTYRMTQSVFESDGEDGLRELLRNKILLSIRPRLHQ